MHLTSETSEVFRGTRLTRLFGVCTCNIRTGTPRFNVNHTLCVLPIVNGRPDIVDLDLEIRRL